MDSKRILFPVTLFFCFLFFESCNDKEKNNTDNTFYVELVNFSNDSLLKKTQESLFGKVSYYQNNELKIISVNYITEDHPDMHFFRNAAELQKDIKESTRKIRMEFKGNYTPDSISYSLQKFIYSNNSWKRTSDMGTLRATNSYQKAKEFAVVEYGKQLMNSLVLYSYN